MNIGKDNKKNREEWLKSTLSSINKGESILDAGAGELQYKKYCSHLKYTAQDFAQYDGQGNKEGLQTEQWDNSKLDIVSDITNIPVPDNYFDNVMCIEVIEHLTDPILAIKEMSRVLKPKGRLILTAPFCSLTHFAPYHFYTGYSKYWYETILKRYGLEIIGMDYNGNYFEYIAQELRRIPFMIENYSISSKLLSVIIKPFLFIILLFLNHFSNKNKASEGLLCYGIHINAKKEL